MARPYYILEKNKDIIVVPSNKVLELNKDGYTTLRIATPEEIETPSKIDIEIKPLKEIKIPKTKQIKVNSKNEISTPSQKKIETPEPKKNTTSTTSTSSKTKKSIPKDLVCVICGVKAKNATSYKKNHGDNCFRSTKLNKIKQN